MLKFKHGNYKQSYRMYSLILSVFRTIFKVSKHARVSSHILAWISLFSEIVYQLQFEYKKFSILQSNLHILHGIDHIEQNIMFHVKYTAKLAFGITPHCALTTLHLLSACLVLRSQYPQSRNCPRYWLVLLHCPCQLSCPGDAACLMWIFRFHPVNHIS